MIGYLTYIPKKNTPEESVSPYQPSNEIKEITQTVKNAYKIGDSIMNRPFHEFNDMSMIERMNQDQRTWLAWDSAPFTSPEEDWRWTGVRPITRNKVIATAAHLTAQLIYPNIFAQNDQDEEDRDASYVMRELLEYNIQHSEYEMAFMYGVISSLVNPITYFKIEYVEAMQEIIEGSADQFTKKKVRDDVLSGFQYSLVPPDEVLIGNAYIFELQRQPFLIHKRRISYEDAEALYGAHENWQYVRQGIKVFYNEDNVFYDVKDEDTVLVEECVYMSRQGDYEIPYVNGVYLGNPNTKYNPMSHRTNKNKPKYGFAKMGAEPIDAMRFFFYKSLVAKSLNDQDLYDRMWQLAMDGTYLSTFPPVITVGAGKIDKSVVVPATVTSLQEGAEVKPISMNNPLNAFTALREAERALSEDVQDPQLSGREGVNPQTARQSILIQQNAETNLGILARSIGNAVRDMGELMVDDIIRYQTTGEAMEILGGIPRMNFMKFVIPNKVKEGKNVTEVIRFTDRFAGQQMTDEQKKKESFKLLEEAGEEKDIYEVNPKLFSEMNFHITIDYDQLLKKNDKFERAFKLEVYDRLISNPMVDQQLVTRDFLLEPLVKGEASKYLQKQADNLMQNIIPQSQQKGIPARITQSAAMEALPA